jgi:hypothetical protein
MYSRECFVALRLRTERRKLDMVDTVYGGIIVFSAAMILYFKYIRSRLSKCFTDRAFIHCLSEFLPPLGELRGC